MRQMDAPYTPHLNTPMTRGLMSRAHSFSAARGISSRAAEFGFSAGGIRLFAAEDRGI